MLISSILMLPSQVGFVNPVCPLESQFKSNLKEVLKTPLLTYFHFSIRNLLLYKRDW